jgi:hypothetical protein
VSTPLLSIEGPFGIFADRLLLAELPDLPTDRRAATIAFVGRRSQAVPSPLQLGIGTLTLGVGIAQRVVGVDRTTAFLRSTSLPFVGELARMVRSLSFAYIWETWPDTSPSGAPGVTRSAP